ncbi:MAG: hypothetical protein ABFD03_03360 [Clostridiaceae bacterium]
METTKPVKSLRAPVIVAAVAVGAWLLIDALRWEIVDYVTVFFITQLLILCLVGAAVTLLVCIIVFIVRLCKRGAKRRLLYSLLMLLTIGAFVMTNYINVDQVYENARFALLSKRFDAAAEEMLAEGYDEGWVKLPPKYAGLSRGGGEVHIVGEKKNKVVMFYSFLGILDNFSVYAYAPTVGAYEEMEHYIDWVQIIPLRQGWYFCASR